MKKENKRTSKKNNRDRVDKRIKNNRTNRKNKKYRKEASIELRKLRNKYKSVRVLKKYRLNSSNTIIYGDYALKN